MGKRFGRNQKRRMQERIDNLQEAHHRESQLARYLQEKGRRDAESVERVASVLGQHFAALPVKTQAVSRALDVLNVARCGPMPGLISPEAMPTSAKVGYAIDVIEAYWAEVRADHLQGQVFVRLEVPGGPVGYALSRSALHSTPPDRLAEEIAKGMVPWLTAQLEKARGDQRRTA